MMTMRIIMTITDLPEGGVKIDCEPKASELMSMIEGGRLGASTSACMYALGMMTWAASRSKEMAQEQSLIVLPPGVRT